VPFWNCPSLYRKHQGSGPTQEWAGTSSKPHPPPKTARTTTLVPGSTHLCLTPAPHPSRPHRQLLGKNLYDHDIPLFLWFSNPEGFPDSSVGKESTCNAGDLGSIPGLGRSLGEGKGYQCSSLDSMGLQRVGHDFHFPFLSTQGELTASHLHPSTYLVVSFFMSLVVENLFC